MKTKNIIFATILLVSISSNAFADRVLERAEILQIFQQLTSQSRGTWIPAGTIEATHQEYKAPKITDMNEIDSRICEKNKEYLSSPDKPEITEELQKMKLDAIPFNIRYELSNEYTMTSTEIVRFDGNRFYWEINVDSRTDSIKPGKDLADNFMTEQFNVSWNSRRIFAWDGEKYTTYCPSVNNAMVDSIGNIPHAVGGSLTAGFIPWGRGYCEYNSLVNSESSAVEKNIDGQMQVHLTVNNADGSQMLFVMDPGKGYAVISSSVRSISDSITSAQYSNHRFVLGNWVPTKILIEKFEAGSSRLIAHDLWNITSIDANVPEGRSFEVEYQNDTLIEHHSVVADKSLIYHRSEVIDTDLLLAKKLAIAATEDTRNLNCATIAMEYTFGQLGRDVSEQQLAQLVSEPDKTTSLYAMKQFAEGQGFYCRTVRTDTQTLRSLAGCHVILHIPYQKHFVVLDAIDDKYVWTIDLASNKFYYRTDISFFDMDWTEGTALLISNQPIELQGNFTELNDTELRNIVGAAGYTCTRLLQEYGEIFCEQPVLGACGGYYYIYWERWGCAAAASGSCSSSIMERMRKAPCIEDPYDPYACDVSMPWTIYYMRACA